MKNDPKGFSQLDEIFEVDTTTGEIVPVNQKPSTSLVDPHQDTTIDEDILFAKSRLKELINETSDFSEFAVRMAKVTKESKDLAVALESIKVQSSLLGKLISIQQKEKKPEPTSGQTVINTGNTVVFSGNANEALKKIRGE